MKTIALIGQKGGTGKTKLAQILVVAFDRAGIPAAGIDLDPQTSFCSWSDLRQDDNPPIIATPSSRVSQALESAGKEGIEVCIIDTAGRAQEDSIRAAKAADFIIIPVQATPDDLMTIGGTLEVLDSVKQVPAVAVLTRVKAQGTRHQEAAEFISKSGLEVCPVTIGERVTYQDAGAAGLSPEEYDPQSKAAEESAALFSFIRDRLEGV